MFSSIKLVPNTPLGREQSKKIKTIIQTILDKPQSYDFQTPVDWKNLGLTDYTFIIKNPMDLGTVSQKIRTDKYRFVEESLDDIQLIWDNCKSYNQPQTWIYKTAESLERFFKKMIKNYLPNIPIIIPGRQAGIGRSEDRKPVQNNLFEEEYNEDEVPYHSKMKFQQKLKHLSSQQLGKIIQIIIQNCPQAFEEGQKDNAQLFIDNIDLKTFEYLTSIFDQYNSEFQDKIIKKIKQ